MSSEVPKTVKLVHFQKSGMLPESVPLGPYGSRDWPRRGFLAAVHIPGTPKTGHGGVLAARPDIGCLREREGGFASFISARSLHHPMSEQSCLITVPCLNTHRGKMKQKGGSTDIND